MNFALYCVAAFLGADLAIEHVTVVDVTDGSLHADQTVLIAGQRIERVANSGQVEVDPRTKRVDGSGKFLIPGLWDMHVHFVHAGYAPLFVAHGVVGVRDMHAHLPFMLLPLRKQVAEGKVVGPRILTAISMVDGSPPMWSDAIVAGNDEEGRKAVQTLSAKGADFVKVYSGLSPEAFLAICDEAKKVGLPVVGHVPETVRVLDASSEGIRSMEHIFGILTASSSKEEELRQELTGAIRGVRAREFYSLLIRSQVKALDSQSPEMAAELYATFAKNRTYQCPTLTVHRMFASLTDPAFREDDRARYTPRLVKIVWKQSLEWIEPITQNASDQRRLYDKTKEIVAAMHRAGTPILAGTDTSNPYCMAGFSLHDELALLVEAGLSPLAALQAATLEAARFLDKDREQGAIAEKMRADLVLLDGNPLADIGNTRKIQAVVLAGKLYDRQALDAMLAEAERKAGK